MIISKHHFEFEGNKVDVYWYEDRYRYTVHTSNGIEYREMGPDPTGLIETMPNTNVLETFLINQILTIPYGEYQLKAKCIRCSKPNGAPRLFYNLAPICNRCFEAMESGLQGNTEYEINPDGSKGSVIKK